MISNSFYTMSSHDGDPPNPIQEDAVEVKIDAGDQQMDQELRVI